MLFIGIEYAMCLACIVGSGSWWRHPSVCTNVCVSVAADGFRALPGAEVVFEDNVAGWGVSHVVAAAPSPLASGHGDALRVRNETVSPAALLCSHACARRRVCRRAGV